MKEFIKGLRGSFIVGLTLGLCIDVLQDWTVFNDYRIYGVALFLSLLTSGAVQWAYKGIIIRKHIPLAMKYACAYAITLAIYMTANFIFLGAGMFTDKAFYLYALLILIVTTPLVHRINKRMAQYDVFLQNKKNSIQ